jgi:hypothetical protein
MEPWPLEGREAAVRAEVSVERDGLPDAKALHYDEAQGVAERVRLAHVRAQEGDGAFFVALPNPFDVIEPQATPQSIELPPFHVALTPLNAAW